MKSSVHAFSFWFISAFVFTASAHAQAGNAGYLADYDYQVSDLSSYGAGENLMRYEDDYMRMDSICANRAEMWAYKISHKKPVQLGKVFIHFTEKGQADENTQWAYHVAPYVLVHGKEMVLDGAFERFDGMPTEMSTWTEYFGKSKHCVVLDPVNNPAHLKLEQNNLPDDEVNPLTYTTGDARQYPIDEGICYIRKVPMYYVYPFQVYGADLLLAGQKQYKDYKKTGFNDSEVENACVQASGSVKSCSKWIDRLNR
jgi:hypothetical protein